jgi:hypothetical protein
MVIDAVLWLILVAMFALIACGCYATRSRPMRRHYQALSRGRMDQAA